jgi:hypothetical protein
MIVKIQFGEGEDREQVRITKRMLVVAAPQRQHDYFAQHIGENNTLSEAFARSANITPPEIQYAANNRVLFWYFDSEPTKTVREQLTILPGVIGASFINIVASWDDIHNNDFCDELDKQLCMFV